MMPPETTKCSLTFEILNVIPKMLVSKEIPYSSHYLCKISEDIMNKKIVNYLKLPENFVYKSISNSLLICSLTGEDGIF